MIIFVSDDSGHFGGVYLWRCEVEEKEKTYKVINSEKYIGQGEFVKSNSLYLLKFYPKNDKRVFMHFEDARNKAVETLEKFIARNEEKVAEDKMKLRVWKS